MNKIFTTSCSLLSFFILISCAHENRLKGELKAITEFNKVGKANWFESSDGFEANKGEGFLVSKKNYTNFKLSLDFFAFPGTNSGVFFRCEEGKQIDDKNCYEVNIFDQRPDPIYRTGAIVNVAPPVGQLIAENSNWNHYEILAFDDYLLVRLNGVETVRVRDDLHKSGGKIALQFMKGWIKFKNISIQEEN
ncbi:MAG: 3-keto-disaccharide hydrolase [Bacteriovoracaceae bacterium]